MRFEIYALEDIPKDTELTFRYDSMNYREGMKDLISIVGELKDGKDKFSINLLYFLSHLYNIHLSKYSLSYISNNSSS